MAQEVPTADRLQTVSPVLLRGSLPAWIQGRFELRLEIGLCDAVNVARVLDDMLRPVRPDSEQRFDIQSAAGVAVTDDNGDGHAHGFDLSFRDGEFGNAAHTCCRHFRIAPPRGPFPEMLLRAIS